MSHHANGSLEIVDYFRRNSVENQNYPVEKFKNALWKTFGIFGEKVRKTEMHRLVAMHLRIG